MPFKLNEVIGNVSELDTDLEVPANHEREELVIPVVKKAIEDVVNALGGYLSVSCNGNINPVSGENGDSINIYITSLTPPNAPAPVPPAEPTPPVIPVEEVTPTPPAEPAPVEPTPEPAPETPVPTPEPEPVPAEPAPVPAESPPVVENTETEPSPVPPVVNENPAENPPVPSPAPEAPSGEGETTPPVTAEEGTAPVLAS